MVEQSLTTREYLVVRIHLKVSILVLLKMKRNGKFYCKYGCGICRSRKEFFKQHHEECNYRLLDRMKGYVQTNSQHIAGLKNMIFEQNKIIKSLQKDMVKFQARTKKAIRQQQIDDLDEFNPRMFRRLMSSEAKDQFFEDVFKKAGKADRYVETFCEVYLKTCKPFFIVLTKNSIKVKGHIGKVRTQGDVGKPGGIEDIASGMFYDAFISLVIDILEDRVDRIYYNNDVTRLKLQSDLYTYPKRGDEAAAKIYNQRKKGLRHRLVDFMKANEWTEETPPNVIEL